MTSKAGRQVRLPPVPIGVDAMTVLHVGFIVYTSGTVKARAWGVRFPGRKRSRSHVRPCMLEGID